MVASDAVVKPVRAFGGFYAVALDAFVAIFKPPLAFGEFVAQSPFVARVSLTSTPPGIRLVAPNALPRRSAFAVGGAAAYRGTKRR